MRAKEAELKTGSPSMGADHVDVTALKAALSELAKLDPRQAKIVEMKFFDRLTVEEIAEALDLFPQTVKREWKTAKMWLRRRMQRLSVH